jgi:hypothetical protein
LLSWAPPEETPPVSSEDIFSLSVGEVTNSYPANYLAPKIYEGRKKRKEREINILVRQMRTTRVDECEICGPNLRAAETLRLGGADESPEFGEEVVDGGEWIRGRRCRGASLRRRRRTLRSILTTTSGQALRRFQAKGHRRTQARRRRGEALGAQELEWRRALRAKEEEMESVGGDEEPPHLM